MDTEPPMASTSDYFNRIIGLIEDVVIAEDFQALQHSFMEKYYEHFDSTTDENRLEYMEIFAEYTGTMETHIVTELQKQMADAFDMERFAVELGYVFMQLHFPPSSDRHFAAGHSKTNWTARSSSCCTR